MMTMTDKWTQLNLFDPPLTPDQIKELARLKKRFPYTTFTYKPTRTGAMALMVVGRKRHD